MWMVTRENGAYTSIGRTKTECGYSDASPVYVVDARKEAFEALVEKVARKLSARHSGHDHDASPWRADARAALSAVFGKGGKP
jgi:predicted GNAT superfamily acetyltransferase